MLRCAGEHDSMLGHRQGVASAVERQKDGGTIPSYHAVTSLVELSPQPNPIRGVMRTRMIGTVSIFRAMRMILAQAECPDQAP